MNLIKDLDEPNCTTICVKTEGGSWQHNSQSSNTTLEDLHARIYYRNTPRT